MFVYYKNYTIFGGANKPTMKKIVITIFAILFLGQVIAQTDKNGNPVFNSISGEKSIDNFVLISNYYTLKNNIENKLYSVFVSETPTLDQIEKAAINLPSDFFILTKKSKMVVLIKLQNDLNREFMTVVMKTDQQLFSPSNLAGDITENRANEIIKECYDPTATIENGKLKFNGKEFDIISNQEIEEAVFALIKKEKLDNKKPSDFIMLSQTEIRDFILTETKEGGKLDFFTEIKGKEYDGVQIKPGVFTTKQSIALYKWGLACFEIGVNTLDDAFEIFAKHKGKPINERERDYIKMGFFKE